MTAIGYVESDRTFGNGHKLHILNFGRAAVEFMEKLKQEDAFNSTERGEVSATDPEDQGSPPGFGPMSAGGRISAADRSPTLATGSQRSKEPFALAEESRSSTAHTGSTGSSGRDITRFQTRLATGRVKLCIGCGGVMTRSTRMVMSPLAALLLIILGIVLMATYGLASNFFQAPWYIKFALPAVYYIGSIFVGVGILFFFIREKVWKCYTCREIRKR